MGNQKQPTGNQPEHKIRLGAVTVTVWKNTGKEPGTSYRTYTAQRSFKDKDGNWQNTESMRINDLPKLSSAVDAVYMWSLQNPVDKEKEA